MSSPPYDVFDTVARDEFARCDTHNIVHVDYPVETDGPTRYEAAGTTLGQWIDSGILGLDSKPSFSIYRMTFVTEEGRRRTTTGVIGALEVDDEGGSEVLPHERTTPKARSDRLDLLRATRTNLSPVWGLSLSAGLSGLLEPGAEVMVDFVDEDGVRHVIERVTDPERCAAIQSAVAGTPVLIADGHHRYAVSRTFRDEERQRRSDAGDLTMTYVAELVDEQLSVAAIHRLLTAPLSEVRTRLSSFYRPKVETKVDTSTIGLMRDAGCICLVGPDGSGLLLEPDEQAFRGIRGLDSARLEHALGDLMTSVSYQHGLDNVLNAIGRGEALCAVLIRPVDIDEIRRTATTGELMPPKSTFFTPKLRTGLVMRPLDQKI